MDRNHQYYLPDVVRENAVMLLDKVNELLEWIKQPLEDNPNGFGCVSSGWRPIEINMATANAAPKSKHMTGHAIDIYDPEGNLDNYITDDMLKQFGLYREHPSQTKCWCHLQDIPPSSGKYTFYA